MKKILLSIHFLLIYNSVQASGITELYGYVPSYHSTVFVKNQLCPNGGSVIGFRETSVPGHDKHLFLQCSDDRVTDISNNRINIENNSGHIRFIFEKIVTQNKKIVTQNEKIKKNLVENKDLNERVKNLEKIVSDAIREIKKLTKSLKSMN